MSVSGQCRASYRPTDKLGTKRTSIATSMIGFNFPNDPGAWALQSTARCPYCADGAKGWRRRTPTIAGQQICCHHPCQACLNSSPRPSRPPVATAMKSVLAGYSAVFETTSSVGTVSMVLCNPRGYSRSHRDQSDISRYIHTKVGRPLYCGRHSVSAYHHQFVPDGRLFLARSGACKFLRRSH